MAGPAGRDAARTRDLLAGYLAGDRSAEHRLFGALRLSLVERARRHRLMGVLRSRSDPEDLVDECLLRALKSRVLQRFEDRGPGSLRDLLASILDRVMKDACRRMGAGKRGGDRGPALPLDPHGEPRTRSKGPSPPPSEDTTPTSAARARELLDFCKETLSPLEWDVWRLAELEGFDSSEVAERVGSTPGAVRSKVRRIRAKLIGKIASPRDPGRLVSP